MSKRSMLIVGLAALVVAVLVLLGYGTNWTGFQAYTDPKGDFHPSKTLWDWMELLIVPLVLGVGAFLLNRSEQRRQEAVATRRAKAESNSAQIRAEVEQNQALDRMREDRLQAYLDRMQDLLEKGLKSSSPQSVILRDIARTRTLTVLRGLDDERKAAVLRFLHDCELIDKSSPIVALGNADLGGARLSTADLHDANLRGAYLSGAHLTGADLRGADLREADLRSAYMSGAKLSGADLHGARYDDATRWPDGIDKDAAGATKLYLPPQANAGGGESGHT